MAQPQARLGDISSHGGMIVTAATKTVVDGAPAARMGDLHACPDHGINAIATGSSLLLIEGRPAARAGDIAGCGAVLMPGAAKTMET